MHTSTVTSVDFWFGRYSYDCGVRQRHIQAGNIFACKDAALDRLEELLQEKSARLVREDVVVAEHVIHDYRTDEAALQDLMITNLVRNSLRGA